jgi:hypothetical protein
MHRSRKVITNTTAVPMEVGLEPWGMYVPLLPGQSLEIVGEGEVPGELEVVDEGKLVAVYIWVGGETLKAYFEGKLIHEF